MNNFAQFLHERGLERADLSAEELAELRREHRREYKRVWQRQADQGVVRKQLTFTKEQYRILQRAAKRHQQADTRFAVNAIEAYLKGMYIVPDEEQVQELKIGLKRIGVLINQIAFVVNTRGQLYQGDLFTLQERMAELESFLARVLTCPHDLNDLIRRALREHPEYTEVLQNLINNQKPL